MKYAIHDAAGAVTRFLMCPEDELEFNLQDGEAAMVVDEFPTEGCHCVVDGEVVRLPDAPDPYTARRRAGYPAIGDQLDALWHAMDSGLLPKIPSFYDPLKAVKDAHPKPPAG